MNTRHIALPAFFPTSVRDTTTGGTMINPEWMRVSGVGAKVKIAVPDGSTKDLQDDSTFPPFHPLTDAKNQFGACRAQGQLILGYVATGGGNRDKNAIMADIDKWYATFTDGNGIHIEGIFFDEGPEFDVISNQTGQLFTDAQLQAFYKSLIHDFKTNHPSNNTAFLNAASFSKEWVMQPVDDQGNIIDYVILWEASEDSYVNNYKAIGEGGVLIDPPAWWTDPQYTDRISHTIVECPPADLLSMLDLSRWRNAGNVYIYNGTTNNYGMLPSYWDQEVANV